MKIDVTARETPGTRCPFCLDAAAAGVVCPRCAARYHDDCAAIVGRCGVLGCTGRLAAPATTLGGDAMPRLRALALRLWRGRAALDWRPSGEAAGSSPEGRERVVPRSGTLDPVGIARAAWFEGREAVVAVLPGRGATSVEGAALVGRLLGQTALDGRLRLSSPVPEPLVRVADVEAGARVVAQLRGAGLDAVTLLLAELVRPLEHVVAGQVVTGPPTGRPGTTRLEVLGARDAEGRPIGLPPRGSRLVVAAQFLQVTRRTERQQTSMEYGTRGVRARGTGRSVQRTVEQKLYDPGAIIFGRDAAPPLFVRLSNLKADSTVYNTAGGEAGLTAATSVARWARTLDQLCAGAAHWTMAGSTNPTLITPRATPGVVGADEVQENLPCVLLAARLLHRAWLDGRPQPDRSPLPGAVTER